MGQFKIESLDAITGKQNGGDLSWLVAAEDSVDFLKRNATEDVIVIYASAPNVLIHGVLSLARKLTPQDTSDLQHENPPDTYNSWSIAQEWSRARGRRMYLAPPLSHCGKALVGAEKLVFKRRFTGVQQGHVPIELSQKLVHSLDLHWVPERHAYCRLDERGDIEEVIKIHERDTSSVWRSFEVVTILRRDLEKFMALSKTALVLRFDFTRMREGSHGWGEFKRYERSAEDLYYHGGVDAQASFCNGVMVVRPRVTVKQLVEAWKGEENPKKRQYATFKIIDRKNNANVETSCAPECIVSYFEQSPLPWEVSPAFFRPEVLAKYKNDPEKYKLEDRSISCRNAWHLPTYDINQAGQVHTYIVYLSKLPYEEQLYWQSFNEWPKGTISSRAHQTDILGEWDLEPEPLRDLKQRIAKLDKNPPAWWKPRGEQLADAVRLPATGSVKEWADELLALDQLLVEGFLVKPLTRLPVSAGLKFETGWGSLRVLQEVLGGCGLTPEQVRETMTPLQQLHRLRTLLKGHAAGDEKNTAVAAAMEEFGTLRAHFQNLAGQCDRSLGTILEVLGNPQEKV